MGKIKIAICDDEKIVAQILRDKLIMHQNNEDILECVRMLTTSKLGNQLIEVYNNREVYQIRQNQVIYARAYNGYVYVVTEKQKFRKDISLIKLLKELDEKIFVQISRYVNYILVFIGNCETR